LVSLEEIQAAYYMVAATGVLIAVVYYVMVLRANEKNKKIQLSTNIAERLNIKDYHGNFWDLAFLDWSDVDDFMKRYDSSANTKDAREIFIKRWSIWNIYDNLGYLLRKNLVDEEVMYNSTSRYCIFLWGRYWPVIDHYRRTELGPDFLKNYEYLARRMWEMSKEHGSTMPFDRYRDVFEPKSASPP